MVFIMHEPVFSTTVGNLRVKVYATKEALGFAAASHAAQSIAQVLQTASLCNVVFSTGASQFTLMTGLQEQNIPWHKVQGFHLDEYVGIDENHGASFRLWLRTRIDQKFNPAAFHYVVGDAPDTQAECARYEALLKANPCHLGFIGIGENGHIAFNDPPVADFNDPYWVKIVELDQASRKQQVGEGWFPDINSVPQHAISLTVPAIMAAQEIISVVPDARKAAAVRKALTGPIDTSCPASILRTHPNATLYLDQDSAALFCGS
jgi:glucosamine-6-phosphate deaminase